MLEIALEPGGGAGVGAHGDGDAGVRQGLQVLLGHFELRLVGLRAAAVPDALLIGRVLEGGDDLGVRLLQEERIVEPLGPRFVDVGRDLAHQGRTVADPALAQLGDQLVVDLGIAHAVRQQVGAGREEALGVVEIVEMRGQPQAPFVRGVDDRLVRLGGHLGARPQVVVDADLHDVGAELDGRVGLFLRLFRRRAGGDVPRDEQARVVQAGIRPLPVPDRDAGGTVAAEAEDGGDAVTRVETELMLDVLLRVEGGIRLEAAHVVHVSVGVDEARHEGSAADVDLLGVRRHLDGVAGPDRLDAAVANHQHAVLDGRGPRAVDDPGAHERLQPRRHLDLRFRAAASDGGHDSQPQQDRKTSGVHTRFSSRK